MALSTLRLGARRLPKHAPKLGMMQQQRFLNIHEYQSMEVFDKFGVAVPKFKVVKNMGEFDSVYDSIGTDCVVKSQVLAGGRGLGYIKENNFQVGGGSCGPVGFSW